jgi:hypothetical protein
VELVIQLDTGPARTMCWKMNVAHLDEARPGIKRLWRSQTPTTPFHWKLKLVTQYYKTFCKNKAMEYQAAEHNLHSRLEQATLALDTSPDCTIL